MESNRNHGVELIVTRIGEPSLVQPYEETNKGVYFLSNLDQVQVPSIIKTIHCFKSEEKGNEMVVEVIKDALSKVLVHYYPAAGRLTTSSDMKFVVDCTNEGVVFVEAEANCNIEVLGDLAVPDPLTSGKLVYDIPDAKNILEIPPVLVQVTKFKCGGFVVGLSTNHGLFDGTSAIDFVKSWGRTSRGLPLEIKPFLDRTIIKARNPPVLLEDIVDAFMHIEDISNTTDLNEEEFCFRTFHFSPDDIKNIKIKATAHGDMSTCTTFEALSGFIWKTRTEALKMKPDQKTEFVVVVDGRSKLEPPLPKGYFGNAIGICHSTCTAGEQAKNPLSFTVKLVRDAIKTVTNDYMRSYIDYLEVPRPWPSPVFTRMIMVSWEKLSFHTTDFGWGEPFMSCRVDFPGKDQCLLLSHGERMNGLKVMLGLPLSTMNTFEELVKQI